MGMMVCAHKFGVIYCKDGQISEDEMLNNGSSPHKFTHAPPHHRTHHRTRTTARTHAHDCACVPGRNTETHASVGAEEGSPAFEEFLACLGDKIRLKGWHGYRGGLDTDSTHPHRPIGVKTTSKKRKRRRRRT